MPYQNTPHLIVETPGTKHYCTCGESANKPYCDGSHETTGKTPAKAEIATAKQVAICDCGKTGTSPFCDGTHAK